MVFCIIFYNNDAIFIRHGKKNELDVIITATENVGFGLNSSNVQRWYGSFTTVDTEKGTFVIDGNFMLVKNNPLVLKTSQSGKQQLCDNKINKCWDIKN